MTATQLLAHAALWAAVGFAFRSICAFVAWLRNRKPAPVSPSRALGADRGGPYRTIAEAGFRDHADLALQVADDAVRWDRARIATIAKAVKATAADDRERDIAQAIIDGIDARPLPMPMPGTGAARKE